MRTFPDVPKMWLICFPLDPRDKPRNNRPATGVMDSFFKREFSISSVQNGRISSRYRCWVPCEASHYRKLWKRRFPPALFLCLHRPSIQWGQKKQKKCPLVFQAGVADVLVPKRMTRKEKDMLIVKCETVSRRRSHTDLREHTEIMGELRFMEDRWMHGFVPLLGYMWLGFVVYVTSSQSWKMIIRRQIKQWGENIARPSRVQKSWCQKDKRTFASPYSAHM